jgi:hypothetical protein
MMVANTIATRIRFIRQPSLNVGYRSHRSETACLVVALSGQIYRCERRTTNIREQ